MKSQKIIIDTADTIWIDIKKEISHLSPRKSLQDWLSDDFDKTSDRQSFARNQILAVLLEGEKVISFGVMGQDKVLVKSFSTILWLPVETSAMACFLYTREEERGHGYAEHLKKEQLKYMKEKGYTHLIWFTSSESYKDLYIWYGAQIIETNEEQDNQIRNILGDEKTYMYVYIL